MDRGEHIVTHDPFIDQDGIFKVIAVPGHERDQHIPAQGQLAIFSRRPVSDNIAFRDMVTHLHQRPLVHSCVLV